MFQKVVDSWMDVQEHSKDPTEFRYLPGGRGPEHADTTAAGRTGLYESDVV